MLGFVTDNFATRFVGRRIDDVKGFFKQREEEHETTEMLRTGKRARLAAASIVLKKLAEDKMVSKVNFDAGKVIVENVCGIANLTYDEKECAIIDGGLTLDMAGVQPKITIYKAESLTKEELIKLFPELKDIKIVIREKDTKPEDATKKAETKQEANPKDKKEDKKSDKPAEEKKTKPVKDESIDPAAPADIGLKTGEELKAEKQKIVEIKKEEKPQQQTAEAKSVETKKEDPKPEEENVVVTPTPEKVEEVKTETATNNSKPMITYADKIREGFTRFESDIFDKVLKKFEKAANDGKLKDDVKITQVLVKRCDKENKLVTFLFVNDNKAWPLLEVFYFTGNNLMSTDSYANANELVAALKDRKEKAKADQNLVKKCYNIKYSSIPGYVETK